MSLSETVIGDIEQLAQVEDALRIWAGAYGHEGLEDSVALLEEIEASMLVRLDSALMAAHFPMQAKVNAPRQSPDANDAAKLAQVAAALEAAQAPEHDMTLAAIRKQYAAVLPRLLAFIKKPEASMEPLKAQPELVQGWVISRQWADA